MSGQLQIKTLGGLAVVCDRQDVEGFTTLKEPVLLVYLAASRRIYPREVLAELFWEDRPQGQALANLRYVLSKLRKNVGPFITIDRATVSMNPAADWQLDAHDFERQCDGANMKNITELERLVEDYHGDFLDGVYVNSTAFEGWVTIERERLRLKLITVLERLVGYYLEHSQEALHQGLYYITWLLQLAPLREEIYRHKMRLLAEAGRTCEALATYQDCQRVFADELDITLSDETTTLYQAIRSGVYTSIPYAKARNIPRNNLPQQVTPFVGRERELTELAALMCQQDERLVTILAPGGMGKTRLVLEYAERLLKHGATDYPNGVFVVFLAPINESENIILVIAHAIGFQFASDERNPTRQLLDYLSNKKMLIVLDNFEHLLDGASLVSNIISDAPGVCIVVTTREKLGLSCETIFRLGGMAYRDEEKLAEAMQVEAIKLFVQCARRTVREFLPNNHDARYIANICRLVQGMPLALLLAASWVDVLSPEEIEHEIQQSVDFLAADMHDMPPRHLSIQAVFEPTWERMTEEERAAFMRFSVFRGGATRDATRAITGADLQTLQALVNKALITTKRTNHHPTGRYEMHKLLRQYATHRLEQSGEADAAHDTHMHYYADVLQKREPDVKGRDQLETLKAVEADFENVRAAWSWALQRKDLDAIDQMMETVYWYCWMRGHYAEGYTFFGRARERLAPNDQELPPLVWARIIARHQLWPIEWLTSIQEQDFISSAKQAYDIACVHEVPSDIAFGLYALAAAHAYVKDYERAYILNQESLRHYRELDERFYEARLLFRVAINLDLAYQDVDGFVTYTREGIKLQREIGDVAGLAMALGNLANAIINQYGEFEEAEKLYQEGLSLAKQMNSARQISHNLFNRTLYSLLMVQGDIDEARKQAEICMKLAIENALGARALANCLLGAVRGLDEDYISAKQLCLDALAGSAFVTEDHDINIGLMMAYCGLAEFEEARALVSHDKGSWLCNRPLHVIPGIAVIKAHDGDRKKAIELLGLAFTHPFSLKGWLHKWALLSRLRDDLLAQLGETVFHAAWDKGTHLDLKEVVQELLREFEVTP